MAKDNSDIMNGYYVGYFTGATGTSLGMFIFKDGIIAGADIGGGMYDGSYQITDDGRHIEGTIAFGMPVGTQSITGATAASEPITIDIPIKLPTKISRNDVHTIMTPLGAINAKFDKVRDV